MESAEIFKRVIFGGFDRNDVINYFEKFQKQHKDEVTALKEELLSVRQHESILQDQNESQTEKIEQLTAQMQAMQETLSQQQDELAAQRKKSEDLQRELSSQKALNTQLQMKNNVLEENLKQETTQAEELKKENESLQNQLSDITVRFQERTGIEIGELLIQAKIDANKIIQKANMDAQQIQVEVSKEYDHIKEQFVQLGGQLGEVEENFRAVSEMTLERIEQVRHQLSGVEGVLDCTEKPLIEKAP